LVRVFQRMPGVFIGVKWRAWAGLWSFVLGVCCTVRVRLLSSVDQRVFPRMAGVFIGKKGHAGGR